MRRGAWIRQPDIWRHLTRLNLSKYAYLINNKTNTLVSRDSVKPSVNLRTKFMSKKLMLLLDSCTIPTLFCSASIAGCNTIVCESHLLKNWMWLEVHVYMHVCVYNINTYPHIQVSLLSLYRSRQFCSIESLSAGTFRAARLNKEFTKALSPN